MEGRAYVLYVRASSFSWLGCHVGRVVFNSLTCLRILSETGCSGRELQKRRHYTTKADRQEAEMKYKAKQRERRAKMAKVVTKATPRKSRAKHRQPRNTAATSTNSQQPPEEAGILDTQLAKQLLEAGCSVLLLKPGTPLYEQIAQECERRRGLKGEGGRAAILRHCCDATPSTTKPAASSTQTRRSCKSGRTRCWRGSWQARPVMWTRCPVTIP